MGFPLKEEKKLKLIWDWANYDFEVMLQELEGKEEVTKKEEKKFQKVLDDKADELATKLVSVASSFQGKIYKDWMAELKLKDPLVHSEVTKHKSWVQENIKYQQETAEKAFDKINKIRQDRKVEYLKNIGDQFEFRVNKEKLGKGDIKYIRKYLEARGYKKKLPNLDKYTADDIKKLRNWVRRRNQLVARDQAGNIYSSEIKELALVNDIKRFKWVTEGDNRVRPTHVVRNGKIYQFKTVDYLPGSEILCRCFANPIKPKKK